MCILTLAEGFLLSCYHAASQTQHSYTSLNTYWQAARTLQCTKKCTRQPHYVWTLAVAEKNDAKVPTPPKKENKPKRNSDQSFHCHVTLAKATAIATTLTAHDVCVHPGSRMFSLRHHESQRHKRRHQSHRHERRYQSQRHKARQPPPKAATHRPQG